MTEPTPAEVLAGLERAAHEGEVFPTNVRLVGAQHHWSGRLWDIVLMVTEDVETMRFVAGGVRPQEVAECAERWASTPLTHEEIALVFRCGGYDPDPFVALAAARLLHTALVDESGEVRHVRGERFGTWISDELALAAADEAVDTVRDAIASQRAS